MPIAVQCMQNMADQNSVVCAPDESKIKINKWRVREGFPVSNGQVILLYELCESNDKEVKRLKSSKCGVVKKRLFGDSAVVDRGAPLLVLSECVHTTVIKDMCADCGADLRQNEDGIPSMASVPMIHSVPELKVTETLAQKLGKADTKRLLEDKKLVLLVDLDQTIIHTTNDNVPDNIKGIYHFQLYGPNSPWYHTRLRPGTLNFLNNMSEFYELHICTFGARNYAHTIAQYLDPTGKYFSHRILSRDECFNITSKTDNLKALFPCGDSMVCIIDDREDVWNMASNLIQVKPYHFFQHTGDINAPPGLSKHELDGKGMTFKEFINAEMDNPNKIETIKKDSLSVNEDNKKNDSKLRETSNESAPDNTNPIDIDENKSEIEQPSSQNLDGQTIKNNETEKNEIKPKLTAEKHKALVKDVFGMIELEDPDDYLVYLQIILKKIHSRFYEIYDTQKEIPDLKELVPSIRSQVLKNVIMVFSGLIPNHMKLEQSRAYMIARSLGAMVYPSINEQTTHLVALTAGTLKVNMARKRNDMHIVTPEWLWCCAERWERVEERCFPLDASKPSKMRQPPPHCHSPEHVVNYNEKIPSTKAIAEEPRFIDTINPLLAFSNADLAEMNKDVDEFFESDSSSDDGHMNIESPPMDKILKKRKRQEEEEEKLRNFFSKTEDNPILQEINNTKDKEVENRSTDEEEDEDESPSAKFRRGGNLPSDLDLGSGSEGSDDPVSGDDGDWNMMGAALEREFLGLD